MKYTEGMFMTWGYRPGQARSSPDKLVGWDDCGGKPPAGRSWSRTSITDAFLQQILTRPDEFDVIAVLQPDRRPTSPTRWPRRWAASASRPAPTSTTTPATRVFEATHGTAPKYAGQDKVNPGSVILSGEMMFRYMGWNEAADRDHRRAGEDARSRRSSPTISPA